MKSSFKFLSSALIALSPAFAANALTLEVAPLALKVKAEVVGVQLGVNGQNAVIFTGKVAKNLAQIADVNLDAGEQMIIATGKEIDRLVTSIAIRGAALTQTAFITTRQLTNVSTYLAETALNLGGTLVTQPLQFASRETLRTLEGLSQVRTSSVIVIGDGTRTVLETGASLVGGATRDVCDLFSFIGLRLGCES
jgi:hypothetical protein